MAVLKGDFHIHSKYSYDSLMEPRIILKLCKKLGFDVISITDHNSINGSLEAKKYEKEFDMSVIIGEEIKTDVGDIIGLNLNEKIIGQDIEEVLENIKGQGGITVLPHPFREHRNIETIANKVDIIEVFNSRCSVNENQKALDLSLKLNIPTIIGSDAHVYSEIGNSIMNSENFFTHSKSFQTRYSKKHQKVASYIIKDIKLHKYYKIPIHVMRLL